MLIGRSAEMGMLNKLYRRDGWQMALVYGDAGVGKTALLSEFSKDKKVIYYSPLESGEVECVEGLSRAISEYRYGKGHDTELRFPNISEALRYVLELSRSTHMVLIIENAESLAHSIRDFTETLADIAADHSEAARLMVVLGSSSRLFAAEEILHEKGALFDSGIELIELKNLDYYAARELVPGFSDSDFPLIYAVTGGRPGFLASASPGKTPEENITSLLFSSHSPLYFAPIALMQSIAREPSLYHAVLRAIALGHTKNSEIAARCRLQTSACSAYLNKLIALGLVVKESPFGEVSQKRAVYSIADSYLLFWYTFVFENTAAVSLGRPEDAWQSLAPRLSSYMDMVFPGICRQWLVRENEKGRLILGGGSKTEKSSRRASHMTELEKLRAWVVTEAKSTEVRAQLKTVSRWWSSESKLSRESVQQKIDIVAETESGELILCLARWKAEPLEVGELLELNTLSSVFEDKKRFLYVFSRSGFSRELLTLAEELGNVTCVDISTIS